MTGSKSYRVYVLIEVSKREVEAIIEEINKKNVALIDVDKINDAAKEVLN